MSEKRLITEKQERALKLCHHDFEGLSQDEAAKIMRVSPMAVSKLLAHVKKVLPQYFPILTVQEATLYHYYRVDGWEVSEISEYTGLSEDTIYKALSRSRKKGMFFDILGKRVQQYREWMDLEVVHQF